jgi:rubredoxin
MDQSAIGKRWCPECKSLNYEFRSRRNIPADPDVKIVEAVETKYRCKVCRHEWRERVSAGKAP